MLCDKKEGVILAFKKVSQKYCLCSILFSDSVLMKVFINSSSNNISVGHQIFGTLYFVDGKRFLKIESIEFFLGISFWFSQKLLIFLINLIKCVLETVPENLILPDLYEEFIEHIKLIHKDQKDCSNSFHSWILKSLT